MYLFRGVPEDRSVPYKRAFEIAKSHGFDGLNDHPELFYSFSDGKLLYHFMSSALAAHLTLPDD